MEGSLLPIQSMYELPILRVLMLAMLLSLGCDGGSASGDSLLGWWPAVADADAASATPADAGAVNQGGREQGAADQSQDGGSDATGDAAGNAAADVGPAQDATQDGATDMGTIEDMMVAPTDEARAYSYAKTTTYLSQSLKWIAPRTPQNRWSDLVSRCRDVARTALQISPAKLLSENRHHNGGLESILIPNLGAPDYLELLAQPIEQLRASLRLVDVFGFHGGTLSSGNEFNDGTANICSFANRGVFQKLRELGKGIVIEQGALKTDWGCDPAFAAMAAVSNIEHMRLVSGVTPDFVSFDEPLKEGCANGLLAGDEQPSIATKADAFAELYHYLHLRYPSVRFGLIEWYPGRREGYPSYGCGEAPAPDCVDGAGDIIAWVDALIARGVVLHTFHLDVARGRAEFSGEKYRRDLVLLDRALEQRGIRFGVIYWSPAAPEDAFAASVWDHYHNVVLKALPDATLDDYRFQNWNSFAEFSVPYLLPSSGQQTSQLELLEEIMLHSYYERVRGFVRYDALSRRISGWACYRNLQATPWVALFAGARAGSPNAVELHVAPVSLPAEAAVQAICGLHGTYRFSYQLTPQQYAAHLGKPIYAQVPVPYNAGAPTLHNSGTIVIE